ncbi:PHB depolymerase family esterase [Frigidibacter sp.]|uniref:extracellular catalytic domain type 1 short-chain-length polyhydroxyalkanoate depolymerase n=1 Tax=Frigidibacter sp. TaxID=2586418 RepID=UPI0027323F40|nr:PHB depolymerase family esterase [Frigidibacter sp.]MDP3340272.1 PHB depolymerase family esterase [Frigidibacter sp.]
MRRIFLIATTTLAIAATLGCAAAQDRPIRDAIKERRAARAAAPAAPSSVAGMQLVEMSFQGRPRSYYVYVPRGAQGRGGLSAVMVLHGGQGSGEGIASTTGMTSAADQVGFVALFPNSDGKQWNDGRASTRSNIDDVGFLRAVIADASARFGVDSSRVFASGLSNGGLMTQRLACDAAGSFRAFGVVVANMPADLRASCSPARPVPMMFFNGTADNLMPYAGGEIKSLKALGMGAGGEVLSYEQTKAFWAGVDGCGGSTGQVAVPDRAKDGTEVSVEQFRSCSGGAELTFYTVEGGGHTWPGSAGGRSRMSGAVTQDISATSELVRFFGRYGL